MRQITNNAHAAFNAGRRFKSRNTEVKFNDGVITMYLHNRAIAKEEVDGIYISDGGYGYSRTTAERLRPFPVNLRGCKGEWILDEKSVWDGNWIKIN
jgi:hypothetical protein